MAKKAKQNISCAGVMYEQGKVYSDESVAHLDQNDFEDVADEGAEVKAPEAGTFAEEKKTETEEQKVAENATAPVGENNAAADTTGGAPAGSETLE